jgi:alpha-beta hydrolase superfamily lysophospholipase
MPGPPTLRIAPPDGTWPRAAVLLFHGFGVDKSVHKPELERIAAAGFLAIGVDAAGHGERRLPDLDDRIATPRAEAKQTMLELALETAAEVPALIDELGLPVALAGISMGAFIVYRALPLDRRLRVGVAILGEPDSDDPEPFRGVALLSITAANDGNVPPAAARALHQRLPSPPAKYVEVAGAEHLLTADQWSLVIDMTIDWLRVNC